MKTMYSFQGDGARLQLYVKNNIFYVSKNRKILASFEKLDYAKRHFYNTIHSYLFQGNLF